ncbi:hypothetical protein AB9E53_20135 [Escherichia coli]|nr:MULTISPECIES: hypothetical protein [Enterobacteriaceae]EFE9644533.1 hypothetical protein [Escherichia coli]EFH3711139.1 hypothetical protein [Escherichia coli]EFM6377096.1 hypothetical protein [Escherichia coli]EFM6391115.1 hypothetical protein [Escherichia coli]EFM6405946.1 hypothetical protein [Escherichia coli]
MNVHPVTQKTGLPQPDEPLPCFRKWLQNDTFRLKFYQISSETSFDSHIVMKISFEKLVVALLFVWLLWSVLRSRQKKRCTDPVIAGADTREQHQWRYVIRGWQILQVLCLLYLLFQMARFILSS